MSAKGFTVYLSHLDLQLTYVYGVFPHGSQIGDSITLIIKREMASWLLNLGREHIGICYVILCMDEIFYNEKEHKNYLSIDVPLGSFFDLLFFSCYALFMGEFAYFHSIHPFI